jgi:hypothetical protein
VKIPFFIVTAVKTSNLTKATEFVSFLLFFDRRKVCFLIFVGFPGTSLSAKENKRVLVRFLVPTELVINIANLWDMAPCVLQLFANVW